MSHKHSSPASISQPPRAPPLPAPTARPLQRARDAASRFLGYSSRPPSPQGPAENERFTHNSSAFTRSSSIGETQNATTSHKTGLEVRTLSINDSGSHAIIAGKEIFKTVRVHDGHCAEDLNIRSAIRSTPTNASGQPRKTYSIDIADVAWAKGDSGDFVAAATSSGKIIVYDLGHAGLQAAQLHEHYRQVHNITFNPHRGSLLLSGSQDGTVRLWDLRDLRNIRSQASTIPSKRKFSGLSDGVRDVKWSPVEGYDFAFGTDNGDVQRWDMRNLQKPKVRIPAHSLGCNTIDWHPDGKHILSAGTDKTVRVFDVSATRPKKAGWEIKTAFPVMHARWRPSCQSSLPQDNGAQLCTQIVTAYDKEHPVMHIWDFRRPLLPFRELKLQLSGYASSPTDLLWHSQDLLWTVGRDGIFLQTDVQHSPKIIDRCNLQALDVSPLGELSFVTQARQQRRVPKLQSSPPLHLRSNSGLSNSPDNSFLSRSWADDGLDHSFLKALPLKPKMRSSSNNRVHGVFSSSSYNHNASATIKLDDVLLNRKSFRPQQMACRGLLLLLTTSGNDPEAVAFLAENLKADLPATSSDNQFLEEVDMAFKANEESALVAGETLASQTWKMVGYCTLLHLKERVALRRKRAAEKALSPAQDPLLTSIENLATRFMTQHMKSPTQSPGTIRPISTIAQQLAIPESTSNVPTPLARPSSRANLHGSRHHQPLPDPDQGEKIVLPPSLASAHASPPLEPVDDIPTKDRRLTVGNLEDLQKFESLKEKSNRHDMVKRWSSQPKAPLSLDPVDADGVKIPPSKFEQYGSGESFQFLEESTGSQGSSFPASVESNESPILNMISARPTRPELKQVSTFFPTTPPEHPEPSEAHQSMLFEGSGTLANSAVVTKENSGKTSLKTSTDDLKAVKQNTDATDFAFRDKHQEHHDTLQSAVEENATNGSRTEVDDSFFFDHRGIPKRHTHQQPRRKRSSQSLQNSMPIVEALSSIDSVIDEAEMDLELKNPWTLLELLQQLIGFYTTEEPYPQLAAILLLLLGPLLPRTHALPTAEIHQTISSYVDYFLNNMGYDSSDIPSLIKQSFEQPLQAGLQPLQVENILATYHEQLLAYRLFNEAAVLRKLAYPAYPAVYEDFTKDSNISLMCGHCGKPMRASITSMRCESCHKKQRSCPVCWEMCSPFENHAGSHLFTVCLLCGHSGHAACLEEWFILCKGEGCPTEGCLCDCVAGGWRAEKAPLAEQETKAKGHDRVKSDEWRAKESEAVEGVRALV